MKCRNMYMRVIQMQIWTENIFFSFLWWRIPTLIIGLIRRVMSTKLITKVLQPTYDYIVRTVLLCLIDPRVRKIRNEAPSCPGIFSSTLRFYYVAISLSFPLPHLLDGHRVAG